MRKLLRGIVTSLFLLTLGFSVIPTASATVSSTNNKNVYNGDGATITWAYTFPIILTSDINIYTISSTGIVTTVTSNYSINTSINMVTYPVSGSPLPVGSQIVLYRQEPITQTSSIKNQYRLPLDVIELAFDKQTMISQQLQEQISRSILSPINTTSASGTGLSFPPPSAGQLIGWTSDASALTNYNIQGLLPTSTPTFAGITLTGLNGILKSSGGSGVGIATADTDYSTPTGSETFTNKTYDTTGTGNVFKVAGTTLGATGVLGTGKVVLGASLTGTGTVIPTASGSFTLGDCIKVGASGNLVDNGSGCSGGSGAVYPLTSGIVTTNTSAWTTSISGSSSQFVMGDASLKSLINSANVNWTDLNASGMIANGALNWTDLNGVAKMNSGGINWNNINGLGPINKGGINWTNFPASGIMKFNGSSAPVAATSSTDYAPATSGSNILYGNGSGGFSNVTVSTGLSFSGGILTASATTVDNGTSYSKNTVYQNTSGRWQMVSVITYAQCNHDCGWSGMDIIAYVGATSSPGTVAGRERWEVGNGSTGGTNQSFNFGPIVFIIPPSYYWEITSGTFDAADVAATPSEIHNWTL